MALSSAALNVPSDRTLYDRVRKDKDERLRTEISIGQDFFKKDEIEKMSRQDLIFNVTLLRKFTGQLESVKSMTSGFDPSLLSLDLTDSSVSRTPSTPLDTVSFQGTSAFAFNPSSPRGVPQAPSEGVTMMALFMAHMKAEAEEKRLAAEAKAEERRLVAEAARKLEEERREEKRLAAEAARRLEEERREAKAEERRLVAEAARKLDEERREAKAEKKRLALEAARRLDEERAETARKFEEDKKREAELRKIELDNQLKVQLAALSNQTAFLDNFRREASERDAQDKELRSREARSLPSRMDQAYKKTKLLLYAMPADPNDLTLYLENVDRLFDVYNVDTDLRVPLLTPHLTEFARRALLNLRPEEISTYSLWKAVLLREHRLTPASYRMNFLNATRQAEESWAQFVTRLSGLLRHYLSSRNVLDSYEKLVELILSDHVRDIIPLHVRHFVADKEADTEWFRAPRIGEIIDRYETEREKRVESSRPTQPTAGARNTQGNFASGARLSSEGAYAQKEGGARIPTAPYKSVDWKKRIRCHVCHEFGHFARDHNSTNGNSYQSRGGTKGRPSFNARQAESSRGPKRCYICNDTSHLATKCPQSKGKGRGAVTRANRVSVATARVDADVQSSSKESPTVQEARQLKRVVNADSRSARKRRSDDVFPHGVVWVDFGVGPVKCLVDSGADVTVLRPDMVPAATLTDPDCCSYITLEAAFGQRSTATLTNVSARMVDVERITSRVSPTVLSCAVTSDLKGETGLLTVEDFYSLKSQAGQCLPEVKVLNGTSFIYNEGGRGQLLSNANSIETVAMSVLDRNALAEGKTANKVSTEVLPLSSDATRVQEIVKFQKDQLSDESLQPCWLSADKENSKFMLRQDNKMLYHKASIGGFEVHQLVVPKEKRRLIIEKAHDSDWSCHYGSQKTQQRIEAYFYWPSLAAEVKAYVHSCLPCQKVNRKTKYDRIPISPVVRAATSFEVVNIDLIGPIVPKSSRGHSYILCLIDSCSRWPEAVPLKTLTAKELCDALLSIFTRIGIPRVVISDNATNMVAGFTQELYARLGIELRRSTVLHPEGNSLVERFNGSLKHMLHHAVNSDRPREWDLQLPFMLWAHRELPNATTGLSPYQLVYGRTSRGPLSVLKDSWSGDKVDVPTVSESTTQYLEILKKNLEVGLRVAEKNAEKAQKVYTDQYNGLSREKRFEVGDLVLVLLQDSSNKLLAQWQGPATVVAKIPPASYRISLDTGAVRVLHANLLRPFVARVDTLGVIFDDDTDFGKIEYCPTSVSEVERELLGIDLSHLDDVKKQELLQLLSKYNHVFSDKPGFCNVAFHEINLEPGFKPKALRPYRIPDKLKAEVDRQIDELLRDGKIRLSQSPFAHPILCVAKPNGDIRVCVDMRYVNSGTVNDAYPMPRIDDMLMKVSSSKFLSTLDCTSGYYQIAVREEDIYKTAFITHRGLYEWTVTAFGLKTAGNTFQRVMDIILAPHVFYAGAYIDDTIVNSDSWKEHLEHLEKVFKAFEKAGMTLRLAKCVFAKPTVKFVGHEVGSGQRSTERSKVEAIKSIPEPHSKKLLRSFLGMANFYRNYIPNFSEVALPLTNLTKATQRSDIRFNEEERAAFIKLKEGICRSVTLYSPRHDRPFIVRTDASDYAVGASLSQVNDKGMEMPIAFASAKLSDVQGRWSTIEKEAYSVIFALQKFDAIVFGSKIDLYSDHNPLSYLANCVPKSSKLTRWSLSLSRYDITVRHIKGVENVVADFLSRCSK